MGVSQERFNSIKDNWKCVLICFIMAIANCQYGYDVGTISGFQSMVGFLRVFGYEDKAARIGWSIDTGTQQLIACLLNVGTIIGVVFTGVWARYLGRKPAIWFASAVSFVGAGIQIGSTNLAGLSIGRLLIGISNAFFMTFANIYIVEVAPPHLRAVVGAFFGIWVNIGAILGTTTDFLTSEIPTKLSYQIPLACIYAIPFVLSILVFFIPESPRWLLVQNRPADAERALAQLRGGSLSAEFFREECEEMLRGIAHEKELASSAAIYDMFKGPDLRRTIICFGVVLSHSSSGLWLFLAYGTYFFQMAGISDAFKISIWTTTTTLAGTMLAMWLMYKHLGRRPMILIGTAAPVVCFLIIAITYHVAPGDLRTGQTIVALTIIYSFFYNGFSGAISWPVAGEIVSSRLRVLTFSMATGINYFFAWLTSFCSPYFINPRALGWGPKYCYIWAASNAVTFVFFYFMLPEVKDRSLEEIDELFQNNVSVKDFPKYECMSAVRAHEAALRSMADEKAKASTVEEA